MDKFVRTGIVTLAGTVALGTAGLAIASANDNDAPVKREDTSVSWMQDTDDDLGDDSTDDDGVTGQSNRSSATRASAPSRVSAPSKASARSKVSVRSVASAQSNASAPSTASAQSATSAPSNASAASGDSN